MNKFILLFLLFINFTSISQAQNYKNVLILLVDDLGWKDLGYSGSPLNKTPYIDALAREGIVFTQAYSAHPVCSPSRAAIMTGKNPIKIGISDWIPGRNPQDRPLLGPEDRHELPLSEKTIAEILKENGYRTFFAGKWHLGKEGHYPEDQGFDVNIGGMHYGSPPNGYYAPYQIANLPEGPDGEYLTDRLTSETLHFMSENKSNPFLAFLSFYTVHTPIQANHQFRHLYDDYQLDRKITTEGRAKTLLTQSNKDYASMVTALDYNIGRLITFLKRENLWENTLVIFTSDNGGLSTLEYNFAKVPTSTRPARGGKGWCYEGGIKIPLIINDPEYTQSATIDEPVIHMDLVPTILSALDLDQHITAEIEGKNILPKNQSIGQRALFWHFPHYHGSGWTPGSAILKDQWKLIYFYEDQHSELYHLPSDPSEEVDLIQKYPAVAQNLQKELFKLIDESDGKYPVNNTAQPKK